LDFLQYPDGLQTNHIFKATHSSVSEPTRFELHSLRLASNLPSSWQFVKRYDVKDSPLCCPTVQVLRLEISMHSTGSMGSHSSPIASRKVDALFGDSTFPANKMSIRIPKNFCRQFSEKTTKGHLSVTFVEVKRGARVCLDSRRIRSQNCRKFQ